MKLSKPILLVMTLLLCWGQLSYAIGLEQKSGSDVTMMEHMDCEDACSATSEACDDMTCPAEHSCSGGAILFLPADGLTPLPPIMAVSLLSMKTYAYLRGALIEHPPRAIA